MQWNEHPYAGFSTQKPWMSLTGNYTQINVEREQNDPDSILCFYKKLISLRKQEKAISHGTISFLKKEDDNVLAYIREYEHDQIVVLNNLSDTEQPIYTPLPLENYTLLLGNYNHSSFTHTRILLPYETIVFKHLKNPVLNIK